MTRSFGFVLILSCMLSLSAGCATSDWIQETVLKRAAFDLGCPQDELTYQQLDGNAAGVRGCGKRATYVIGDSCGGAYMPSQCTIKLNMINVQTPSSPDQRK